MFWGYRMLSLVLKIRPKVIAPQWDNWAAQNYSWTSNSCISLTQTSSTVLPRTSPGIGIGWCSLKKQLAHSYEASVQPWRQPCNRHISQKDHQNICSAEYEPQNIRTFCNRLQILSTNTSKAMRSRKQCPNQTSIMHCNGGFYVFSCKDFFVFSCN